MITKHAENCHIYTILIIQSGEHVLSSTANFLKKLFFTEEIP